MSRDVMLLTLSCTCCFHFPGKRRRCCCGYCLEAFQDTYDIPTKHTSARSASYTKPSYTSVPALPFNFASRRRPHEFQEVLYCGYNTTGSKIFNNDQLITFVSCTISIYPRGTFCFHSMALFASAPSQSIFCISHMCSFSLKQYLLLCLSNIHMGSRQQVLCLSPWNEIQSAYMRYLLMPVTLIFCHILESCHALPPGLH